MVARMGVWTTYLFLVVTFLLGIAAADTTSNPFTVTDWNVVTGTTFTITWTPTFEGRVAIVLVSLSADDGETVLATRDLYTGITNSGLCDWEVKEQVFSILYSIRIESIYDRYLSTESPRFSIKANPNPTSGAGGFSYGSGNGYGYGGGTTQSSTTTNPSQTPSPTAGTPITDSESESSASSASSSGLSPGAAAGVGVGVTLGAILLLGIGGFFWWIRRKRTPAFGPETSESAGALEREEDGSEKNAVEMGGTGTGGVSELDGNPRVEIGGTPRSEVQGSTTVEMGS